MENASTDADPIDPAPIEARLRVDVFVQPGEGSSLAADVRAGLAERPRRIPPKHFYDARGARLFDAICDTPEYYPTRTEQALLEAIVDDLLEEGDPTMLVELGSGAARKTRTLIEAMLRRGAATYVPIDVSEEMLRRSARTLLADYPTLRIHGLVADYDRHLGHMPDGGRHLIAFLGSTIGNFTHESGARFLGKIAESMGEGDRLLLGLDQVKDPAVLHAAYNDAEGLTAAFNKNVLRVMNAQLDADFPEDGFEHVAFYDAEKQQVEMHLEAMRPMEVRVAALELTLAFEEGERIHTEISRKFTRESAERLLADAGLALERWDLSEDGYFALATARGA